MGGQGEFELIAALRELLPGSGERVLLGSGDDAAVVRAGGDRTVVSVDTTVDGVHARLDLGDRLEAARAFGWRALTTALSDLAAMGAAPGEAYVAIGAPGGDDELLLSIGEGVGKAATRFGTAVIGGDLTRSPVVFASVTVVGWLAPGEPPLTRGGAQPGDLLGLTGPIGGAGGGLLLQLAGGPQAERSDPAALREHHLRPIPRLSEGAALRRAGAHAAIDISDGLAADAAHLANASGVHLAFDADAIPIAVGLPELLTELDHRDAGDPLAFAQAAGEDFELLVAVPPEQRAAAEQAGVVAWVGAAYAGEPAVTGLRASERAGHDHFA